jgi:hypothetical protein
MFANIRHEIDQKLTERCDKVQQINKGNNKITELRTILQRESRQCVTYNIFDIYVTEYSTSLTTILPILFLYLNTVTVTAEPLNRNESERFGALKSDSTHHFSNRLIRVITKLPNSEQSYKEKVKTHNYINRQSQSTN